LDIARRPTFLCLLNHTAHKPPSVVSNFAGRGGGVSSRPRRPLHRPGAADSTSARPPVSLPEVRWQHRPRLLVLARTDPDPRRAVGKRSRVTGFSADDDPDRLVGAHGSARRRAECTQLKRPMPASVVSRRDVVGPGLRPVAGRSRGPLVHLYAGSGRSMFRKPSKESATLWMSSGEAASSWNHVYTCTRVPAGRRRSRAVRGPPRSGRSESSRRRSARRRCQTRSSGCPIVSPRRARRTRLSGRASPRAGRAMGRSPRPRARSRRTA
jgi:hypothetical protein